MVALPRSPSVDQCKILWIVFEVALGGHQVAVAVPAGLDGDSLLEVIGNGRRRDVVQPLPLRAKGGIHGFGEVCRNGDNGSLGDELLPRAPAGTSALHRSLPGTLPPHGRFRRPR